MGINWTIIAGIVIPLVAAVLGAAAARWWERRPRVIAYLAHATGCRVKPQEGEPFYVNVHTVVLRNDGSRAATNVRLGHQPFLFSYHVQPTHQYDERRLSDGGLEIVFPSFPPKRIINITYLYSGVTWDRINTHLESDEGPVTVQNVMPTRRFSKRTYEVLTFVFLCGVVSITYIVWLALRAAFEFFGPMMAG